MMNNSPTGENNVNNNMNMNITNNIITNNTTNFPTMNLVTNNEITVKFSFTTGLYFLFQCNINEKLSEAINRLKKINEIKEPIRCALSEGQKLDEKKTILELGITNMQIILLVCQINNENNITQIITKYYLREDEKIQLQKWMEYFNRSNLVNIDNNGGEKYVFFDFVKQQEKMNFIIVKEHSHKLVYCISLLDWECSLCTKKYNKENAKYYCSLCDFNMCEICHSKGNYLKKKAFPDEVKPSNKDIKEPFLKSNHHQHKLIYCRSSRSVIGYNTWRCDICNERFKNNIWSFYCTQCDFDLCCNCADFN